MRGEDLKKRVAGVLALNQELGTGFANIYTRLGKQAVSKENGSVVGSVIGNQRTFCNLPKKDAARFWQEAINDAASDEVLAHMSKSRSIVAPVLQIGANYYQICSFRKIIQVTMRSRRQLGSCL